MLPPGVRGGSVEVHGHRLHFSVHPGPDPGSGTPLLLINGFGAGLNVWARLQTRLNMESVAFDLPGAGRSRSSTLPLPMAMTTRIVQGLLDKLGYDRVDVLGLSMGGGIAQQLAYRSSSRVRRLILAATHFGLGSVPGSVGAMLALANPLTAHGAWPRRLGPRLYGGGARHDGGSLASFAAAAFTPPPTWRSHAWALMTVATWWSLPFLPFLAQPTLVLAGDDDPLVPLVNARILGAVIPNATVRVLPGAGHLFVFENAEETADLVNRFLLSSNPGSRRDQSAV